MSRKESEKDSERPHYYSQFWLDVAAGRRVIGAPKGDEAEMGEPEGTEPVMPTRRTAPARPDLSHNDLYGHADDDGRQEVIAHPVVDPIIEQDDIIEPAELDLINDEANDLDTRDSALADSDIPDMDLEPIEDEEENEEDDFFDEEDEDEEESGWGRGRKKPSPKRPTKQPTKRPGKRDTRRGF